MLPGLLPETVADLAKAVAVVLALVALAVGLERTERREGQR